VRVLFVLASTVLLSGLPVLSGPAWTVLLSSLGALPPKCSWPSGLP
jgi:hypothetical protein